MQDWTSGKEIVELNSILISEPPPLPPILEPPLTGVVPFQPPQEPTQITSREFDLTYNKETDATVIGVLLVVILITIKLSVNLTFDTVNNYNQTFVILSITSLILKIIITVWVMKIASRQNRNSTNWGWFAFFLPSLALIIIGQLKKLRLKIELDGSFSASQQVAILLEKANELYTGNRYLECIEILNIAIEIEIENFECLTLRGLSYYQMKNYGNAKSDFENLIKNEKFVSIANLYLGNLAILDKKIELAVSFWLKADELKNENAKVKLDLYQTYTGHYLLDKSNVAKKLTKNYSVNFGEGKYIGGLTEIDNVEKLSNLITELKGYDNGLEIELRKTFKTYHICIAYYEIDDIIFKDAEKEFELHLADGKVFQFQYDHTKDYNNGLKNLCNKFKQATGKTTNAEILLKE